MPVLVGALSAGLPENQQLIGFAFAGIRTISQQGRGVRLSARALTGVLEASDNIFFALASASGRLDIAAVLASLYPAATVFLAWLVLKECLSPRQWMGIVATLGSVILITGLPTRRHANRSSSRWARNTTACRASID